MAHLFSQIPRADIERSVFNRSHGYKTTLSESNLVPIFVDEVLPGDSFTLNATSFCRMATPITPIMDNLYFDTFWFFIPNRLVWDNWQKMNGEQENPGDSTDYLVPMINSGSTGFAVGSLADYFGIPTGVPNIEVSALPFRAYWLCYREWFRDENLQQSPPIDKSDSPKIWTDSTPVDGLTPLGCAIRGKRHDYFTSCLPWPQKGPGVELPLGIDAPIVKLSSSTSFYSHWPNSSVSPSFGAAYSPLNSADVNVTTPDFSVPWLAADLSSASAATINSLRLAFQLQRLYERDSRGGTRYTEILRSHFGVISPDARLQRPEYLGGSSNRFNINPIAQTSSTDSTTPQGNLAAFGVMSSRSNGFTKSFVEHGYIIGLANVRADLNYQQGINRMWSRQGRFDFYWPALAHLGEQAVLNKEIFAQGTSVDDDVFGYQERWAEYRYYPNLITGKMRSTDPQSLDVWHLAQKFDSLPTLSNQFIQDKPPIDRVVAVPSEPHFLLDLWFDMKCTRPMPVYSVPGLMDHF